MGKACCCYNSSVVRIGDLQIEQFPGLGEKIRVVCRASVRVRVWGGLTNTKHISSISISSQSVSDVRRSWASIIERLWIGCRTERMVSFYRHFDYNKLSTRKSDKRVCFFSFCFISITDVNSSTTFSHVSISTSSLVDKVLIITPSADSVAQDLKWVFVLHSYGFGVLFFLLCFYAFFSFLNLR